MRIPNTLRLYQLYLQPSSLLRNNIGDSISPAIVASVRSSSDTSFTMDSCKKLEIEKEELKMLLNDYKTRRQDAMQDIAEKETMLSALSATIARLQELV